MPSSAAKLAIRRAFCASGGRGGRDEGEQRVHRGDARHAPRHGQEDEVCSDRDAGEDEDRPPALEPVGDVAPEDGRRYGHGVEECHGQPDVYHRAVQLVYVEDYEGADNPGRDVHREL